ncbi:DUF6252 family protein [Wenyingzhuangia sp. IMCC45533]
MKKKLIVLGILGLSVFYTSCDESKESVAEVEQDAQLEDSDPSKLEDDDPEGIGKDGTLSAKIDGELFVSLLDKTESKRNKFSNGSASFSVTAKDKDLDKFTLIISQYTGVGTYDIEGLSMSYHVKGDDKPHLGQKTNPKQGKIIISSDDGTTVKGTFEFVATSFDGTATKTITEGQFSVKPQVNEINL